MKKCMLAICILLCCMAAGCTKKDTIDHAKEKAPDTGTQDGGEGQEGMRVTVWLDAENGYANRTAIGQYESGEALVEGDAHLEQYYQDISWDIVDKSYLTPEQYRRELQEALDRGEGQDIIYMDTYNRVSPQELMGSGMLAEIVDPADYYGEDMDYLAGVLEAGQREGKQYVLPVGIQCPVLFGIDEDLKEAGIDTEDGYAGLRELLRALLDAHGATGRDILEDTQALDWLEQYYVEEGDTETRELLAQARDCCGDDRSTFAAYDALDGKTALLGGCGVMDNRKVGQNVCLFSEGQQPAFLYVPAADGVCRAVVTEAVGVNARSAHAAEVSRALSMYRKIWLSRIIGMGPFADGEQDYWDLNLNTYVLALGEISDRRYASRSAKLLDKTVSAYREFVSGAVEEASYAVQLSAGQAEDQGSGVLPEQDKKVISVLYSDLGLGEGSGTARWLCQAAEGFNASQEGYHVQLLRSGESMLVGSYEWMAKSEGASEPDIVLFPMLDAFCVDLQFADMSGFLEQHSAELSSLPGYLAGGIACRGVTAGLPYAAEEYGIWCNRQTLRRAGLGESWVPEDMQGLMEGLRQLKVLDGIQTAAVLDEGFRYLFTFMDPGRLDTYLCRDSGGGWKVSAQAWASYMEKLQQMREEGLAVPLSWRGAGITEEDAAAGLIDGTVGAVLSTDRFGGWYDGAHEDDIVSKLWQMGKEAGEVAEELQWFEPMEE